MKKKNQEGERGAYQQADVELSVIIPVLNEEKTLKLLFENIFRQQKVDFEVIFCDGGSTDGTLSVITAYGVQAPFPVRVVRGAAGRGRQMNAGVGPSRGQILLFLHADSSFKDPRALRLGLDALRVAWEKTGHSRVAGRFKLCFDVCRGSSPAAYSFYETKARLNRSGCIHGDQGFLMGRSFFAELGGFREDLPILEDEKLAEAVFGQGRWMLLPAEITTSARRFAEEGFFERQVLNALILNCHAIGWYAFFEEARTLYRQQQDCGPLKLTPFFDRIAELLGRESWPRRFRLWRKSGAFVNGHAWQAALFCDCRRRHRLQPQNRMPCLRFYDERIRFLVENPFGRWVATFLVWGWFHCFRGFLHGKALLRKVIKGYS
ncbi:MAG: glycosyltransferase family 2 protein [Deltaproteobacteria bacterium]|nr:glycosyltransferase family 2 protein [Deltaproteobacteria bacterium]